MASVASPLYDISQTFEENFHHASTPLIAPSPRYCLPRSQWIRFLEFSLASRVGAAACAATTGKGIALLAPLGFDVLTYKTIRRQAHPSHPLPNIVHVDCSKLLNYSNLDHPIYVQSKPDVMTDKIAISNSFGNGCLEPSIVMQDIAFAKRALSEGQILIVSVYGEGNTRESMMQDFAETALLAKAAGADMIELNLSCPNLLKQGEPIYCDVEEVYHISARVVKCIGEIPILLKLGLPPEHYSPRQLLEAAARAGVRGISAINSISIRVLDDNHQPVFGKRVYSGVSGYPIRTLALKFIKKLAQVNREEKLNLAILGIGGITLPEHFNEFFEAGADIALSASGMMWNPLLAWHYHQQMQP